MREYKKPEAEVLEFSKEDIIRTSSLILGDEDDGEGGDFTGSGGESDWGEAIKVLY